jgi:hypothetical protein
MKSQSLWQIFEKYSNIKFNENRPIESELFHADGLNGKQRNKHDEADSGLS